MHTTAGVDRLGSPPYVHFLHTYLILNRPLLIASDLVRDWSAFSSWTTAVSRSPSQDTHSAIDWTYLSSQYGHLSVNITDCGIPGSEPCTSEIVFRDVIELWHRRGDPTAQLLYVKDWHLPRWVSERSSNSFYITPSIFADDWLNYYYSTFTNDDFRFVYIGVKGTFTPFHKDVYDSYSWSTNVVGRKLWTFWSPDDVDRAGKGLQVVQEQGETVFVPSGWYHTVENLTTCISINHNWCNSVNLPAIYDAICRRILDVERELSDVKQLLSSNAHAKKEGEPSWDYEWMTIVQDVLEKDAGWNWSTFWQMVLHGLEAAIRAQDVSYVDPSPSMLFPPAPKHLQPALTYVKQNVVYCFDKFRRRQEEEHKGELDLLLKPNPKMEEFKFKTLRDVVSRIGQRLR